MPALLYTFTGSGDGAKPLAGLAAGPGSVLCGAACLDTEVSDAVTILQLSRPASGQTGWRFYLLYSFPSGNSAGNCPIGTLPHLG